MQNEIEYLTKLVSFKTESHDISELKKCAQYLGEFFKSKNLHTEILFNNDYPSIVATAQKTKTPKILLQAHMDVVPAQDEQYVLKEGTDKLYGRGVFDMKFAVASYMRLLDLLEAQMSKYDFGIMITFDEEIGGKNGVEALLKSGYSCDVVILPDSGKGWVLENSAMGAWFVKLSKVGKSAHGSVPEKGINSAEILTQALERVFTIRDKFSSDDLSLSLTIINSGKAINQIPAYAEAVFDIRYRNQQIFNEVERELEKISKQFSLDRNTEFLGSCLNVPSDDPMVKKFITAAEKVLGRKVKTGHSKGSTDGRYFCEHNIPCIVMQPDGGGRHSDEEWIKKDGPEKLTQILYSYITENA